MYVVNADEDVQGTTMIIATLLFDLVHAGVYSTQVAPILL